MFDEVGPWHLLFSPSVKITHLGRKTDGQVGPCRPRSELYASQEGNQLLITRSCKLSECNHDNKVRIPFLFLLSNIAT